MKTRYLCLIYLNEQEMDAMPATEMNDLNGRHLDFNDALRKSGHFIVAEALQPASQTACIRVRKGKVTVTDGPFAETKELVAGFYLIEADDLREAIDIAARIPSAGFGTVEVRPARQLVVAGRELRWG
ncbi:MAG: dehydrogenase [Blastocatellia bacterium]|nr:MAG: dehydrogenase [Blastocatellia bacterium]